MATNHFKSFIPYRVNADVVRYMQEPDNATLEDLIATDPTGMQWRRIGLTPVDDMGSMVLPIGDDAWIMAVKVNERILPGKVIAERVEAMCRRHEEREGRKPKKKDKAMYREEAELELLPKAFVRRAIAHVIITREGYMLVCCGSFKRADDAIAVIAAAMQHVGVEMKCTYVTTQQLLTGTLTELAKNNFTDGDTHLFATDNAVLKGEAKRTVRVRSRDLGSHEVQSVLDQQYQAVELGLAFQKPSSAEPEMTFRLSDSMVFRGCSLGDLLLASRETDAADQQSAFISLAFIASKLYVEVVKEVCLLAGGEKNPFNDDTSSEAATSDDEEL